VPLKSRFKEIESINTNHNIPAMVDTGTQTYPMDMKASTVPARRPSQDFTLTVNSQNPYSTHNCICLCSRRPNPLNPVNQSLAIAEMQEMRNALNLTAIQPVTMFEEPVSPREHLVLANLSPSHLQRNTTLATLFDDRRSKSINGVALPMASQSDVPMHTCTRRSSICQQCYMPAPPTTSVHGSAITPLTEQRGKLSDPSPISHFVKLAPDTATAAPNGQTSLYMTSDMMCSNLLEKPPSILPRKPSRLPPPLPPKIPVVPERPRKSTTTQVMKALESANLVSAYKTEEVFELLSQNPPVPAIDRSLETQRLLKPSYAPSGDNSILHERLQPSKAGSNNALPTTNLGSPTASVVSDTSTISDILSYYTTASPYTFGICVSPCAHQRKGLHRNLELGLSICSDSRHQHAHGIEKDHLQSPSRLVNRIGEADIKDSDVLAGLRIATIALEDSYVNTWIEDSYDVNIRRFLADLNAFDKLKNGTWHREARGNARQRRKATRATRLEPQLTKEGGREGDVIRKEGVEEIGKGNNMIQEKRL
jgi:hypothetical protein